MDMIRHNNKTGTFPVLLFKLIVQYSDDNSFCPLVIKKPAVLITGKSNIMRMAFLIIYQLLAHVRFLNQCNPLANPLVLAHPDNKVVWVTRYN